MADTLVAMASNKIGPGAPVRTAHMVAWPCVVWQCSTEKPPSASESLQVGQVTGSKMKPALNFLSTVVCSLAHRGRLGGTALNPPKSQTDLKPIPKCRMLILCHKQPALYQVT